MISANDYLSIANYIGDSYDSMASSIAELTSMRATLQQITLPDDNNSRQYLQLAINQTGTALVQQQSVNTVLKNAISALQNHVTKNFGSVDSFLASYSIKISQSFANISAKAGYVISSSNIV